jgi:error-prone DNA polymerase
MPDLPPAKRQPVSAASSDARRGGCAPALSYAELHCRTNFSFLEGASHPDELVQTAAQLGYRALAVTDRNSLAGVVRAHVAAKEVGLKLLIGAEVTPIDAPPAVLLATDRNAYGRLCRLLTRGRTNAPKGECRLTFDDIAEHAEGLLACVAPPFTAAVALESKPSCSPRPLDGRGVGDGGEDWATRDARPPIPDPSPARGEGGREYRGREFPERSAVCLDHYREAFSGRCYVLAELHHGPDDRLLLAQLRELARAARLPLVAANDVHYHEPQRRFLQDVLTAIREGTPVARLGDRLFPNGERYLKSPEEMARLFAECPEAVSRTCEVAARCTFSLDELRYEYPEELCPPGMTAIAHLTQLTWQGAASRYPQGIPEKVRRLVEHELQLIAELRYEPYFLTVWDLVQFARSRGILCQGRGSAANSAVCYCLEVTSVDPERIDVLFERFVSKERNEAPDIDVDFEHERREEVIQYVYEKYGRDRAGMTAEVISYRPRSAVRDVGKALGLSLDRVDALAKSIDHIGEHEKLTRRFREAGLNPLSRVGKQLVVLTRQILGFPRHLSQHVGGMVITHGPLCELVPIENASMPGRTVIEWDKDDLDALGILKVDCLALGMLTAIRKCFDLVERHYGRCLTLATVPAEDPKVYEMVSRADTMGVFQIESRAQMAMLPRLRPNKFYDLVIEVAIVRPGPIQGDMVHPYLRRRAGEEAVEYPDDRVREVLEKTMGVPIFQEQAMRLAVVAAGFTPGEADQLRRAMGAWRRPGVIDQFQIKLMEGMQRNGYSADFADRVFRQIRGFGEYGFPESHAASFALLVYVSSWLKCYYPAAFAAALVNSQPMGFYAPAQLVGDARRHGVEVLPIDVNFSNWDCTLEASPSVGRIGNPAESVRITKPSDEVKSPEVGAANLALRLGLRLISGLSETHCRQIEEQRGDRLFASLDEFARRTRLGQPVLARLSRADAFVSLGLGRRDALWQSLPPPVVAPVVDREKGSGVFFRPDKALTGNDAPPGLKKTPDPLTFSGNAPLYQKQLPLFRDEEPAVQFSPLSPLEEVVADYRTAGLSLRDHPVKFVRPQLRRLKVVTAAGLKHLRHDARVHVAGLVLLRQRPGTASGITFVTLEDETGFANLIVRPEIWDRYHRVARRARGLIATGTLQRRDEVIHILVTRLRDLSAALSGVAVKSRDFR